MTPLAGYSGFVVARYDKTGESCHEPGAMAGYSGFAVEGCDKSGKSCHDLEELAGYSAFVVTQYGTTGKSCQRPSADGGFEGLCTDCWQVREVNRIPRMRVIVLIPLLQKHDGKGNRGKRASAFGLSA